MRFQPFWTLIIKIWNITDLATISCPLQLIITHLLSYIIYCFFSQAIHLHFKQFLIRPKLILLSLKICVSITQNCWRRGSNTLVYVARLTLTPLSATYTFTHKKWQVTEPQSSKKHGRTEAEHKKEGSANMCTYRREWPESENRFRW